MKPPSWPSGADVVPSLQQIDRSAIGLQCKLCTGGLGLSTQMCTGPSTREPRATHAMLSTSHDSAQAIATWLGLHHF